MKKIFYTFMAMAAALSVVGCAKELEEAVQTSGNAPEEESGYIVLGASLPDSDDPAGDTKTTISKNEGKSSYSVFWADGDVISVNGQASKPANIDPSDAKKASFTLPASVKAPYYCAVYPAALASGYQPATAESGTEGEEGYVAAATAQFTVSVPKEQHYVENGVDPSTAIMYAYSTDASKALKFNHTMAYLKVNVKGTDDNDNIKSVRINGNDNEMLSGDYVLSISSDGFVFSAKPVAGSNKAPGNTSVEYLCGESGVAQNTDMFIAIPVGKYDNGLTITIVDVNNHYCVIKSLKDFTASSGIVYPTELPFKPGADDVYLEGGIYTVEDWNAFIASVNDGTWENSKWNCEVGGNKGAHLMADIYSATNLPRTSDKLTTDKNKKCEWSGTFYGHNHTITHNGYEQLFTHVGTSGKIQDLTVSGNRKNNVLNAWPSVIALNNAGEINNCESKVNFDLKGSSTNVAGICRTNTGTIINCRNSGSIKITEPTADVNIAGITLASSGTIKNCTNSGEIIIGDKEGTEANGIDRNCIVAGVVQRVSGVVEGLTNTADVTINVKLTAMRTIYLGGVIANTETADTDPDFIKTSAGISKLVKSCSNTGTLRIIKRGAYHMKGGAIGGVAASVNSGTSTSDCAIFDSCVNSGDIMFYETETILNKDGIPYGAYAVGGILGRCAVFGDDYYYKMGKGTYTVIRVNCINKGNIDVCVANGQPMKDLNSGARQTYVGAIAGFVGGGIVRGNKDYTRQITIKLGSLYGGICAGGILGGAYGTDITGGPMNANVKYEVTNNGFVNPVKIGYVGAVLGWATSSVKLSGITAVADFNNLDILSDNLKYGLAGVTGVTNKDGKVLYAITVTNCNYNGSPVTSKNVFYGTGTITGDPK